MPWDTPWHWQKFIKTFKPRALAISRTDTWPNMVWEAHKAQIPSLLFSATLPKESGRVASFWGRLFYQSIFKDLTKISVVSEEDKENFRHISESLDVFVEGDTRFDQVISRVEEKRTLPEWCNKLNGPAFVAGSTWPEDERHLFVAIAALSRSIGFTTIVAPHEPTPEHLKNIENKLVALGLKSQRFSEVGENPSAPVLIVDSVGILADLYRLGQVAFVGGSFKKTVHSVMEPAASGCLTLFGPYYRNNREAIALRNAKLAYEVAGAADLEKRLQEHFQKTNEEKESLRKSVLRFVQGNKGVSQKIAQWVIEKSFQSG
jgi:3-deoxy-D-manno-octulosonic-acid transferase